MTLTEPSEIVDRATGEIVRYTGTGPMLPARQSPAELAQQAREVRELQQAVLTEGTDYGTIPGTQRPSLYKSGAEWLLKWAGYGHRLEPVEVERDDQGRKFGVTYRCTVFVLGDQSAVVSTCDGYAGYDEDRFYQSQASLEARERANAERYRRQVNPSKFAEEYRAPWNSVLKMAEKRALVGSTLQATATSGLFTQDMEDHGPGVREDAPFIELGWASKAEYVDAREALVGFVKSDLDEDAKAALKEWMAEEGYGFGSASSPDVLARIRAKAEELVGEGDPFAAEPFDKPAPEPPPATAEGDDPMQRIVEEVRQLTPDQVDTLLRGMDVEPEGSSEKRRLLLAGLRYQQETGSDLHLHTHPVGHGAPQGAESPPEADTVQPPPEPVTAPVEGQGAAQTAESGQGADPDVLRAAQEAVSGMPSAQVVAELVRRNLSSSGASAVRAQRLVEAIVAERPM